MLGNRMLNGNVFRYPVRSVHEARNFVRQGMLRTSGGLFSLWQGAKLAVDDLVNYFHLDNELVSVLHQQLSAKNVPYTVNKFCLKKGEYHLDAQISTGVLAACTDTLPRLADEQLPDEDF
jgi:hypothetical protein